MKKHMNNRFFEWKREKSKNHSFFGFKLKRSAFIVFSILLTINVLLSIFVDKSIWGTIIDSAILLSVLLERDENGWDISYKWTKEQPNT